MMEINSADIMAETASALKAQLDILNFFHPGDGRNCNLLVPVKDKGGGKRIKLPHKLPSMPQYQRNVNLTAIDDQRNRNLLTNTLQFQILQDLHVVSILRHPHLHKKSLDSFIIDEAVTVAKIKKRCRQIVIDDGTAVVEAAVELGYIAVAGGREHSEGWIQSGAR
jgi:hypothetical protein